MNEYALFLYQEPDSYADLPQADVQQMIMEVVAWRESLAKKGCIKAGFKLAEDLGQTIVNTGKRSEVVDGPYAEIKEVLGGIFVIQAASYEEAVELAASCPYNQVKGRIEVRLVDQGYK